MTSLLTITFSGNSSVLQANFCPEITFDPDENYSCALLDLIVSKNIEKIANVKVARIDCDIISGSYINGRRSQTIHQFTPNKATVKLKAQREILVEDPTHLNYLPIKIKTLRSIQISIVDTGGKAIDLSGTDIFCRINIKRDIHHSKLT